MKSSIKKRLEQMQGAKTKVLNEPSEYVDKSSCIQMIDFNIQCLKDIIVLVDAVNSENQKVVSKWFARFRED